MKKRYSYFFFVGVAGLFAFSATAQDTLRTDQIDIVKPFKPILSEAMKIQSNPNPEIPEVKVPTFTYDLPEKKYDEVKPTLYTIKPLSMGTFLLPRLKNNYTRVGYGNYNSPLFEVYLNTVRNKNLQGAVFYKHLSANPSGDRTFSNNTVQLSGKRFVSKGIITADASYERNRVNLYGHADTIPAGSSIGNLFQTFDLNVSYGNIRKDTSKLGYQIFMNYYNFSGFSNSTENNFNLGGDFHKSLKGNPLDVHTNIMISSFKGSGETAPGLILNAPYVFGSRSDLSRVFVDINPRYRIGVSPRMYVQLGFNATFYNDNSTTFYFFPAAEAGFSLIPNSLTFYTGITGNLQRHTYRSIATENAFVRDFSFANTENRFELYAGLKGLVSPQTSFMLQASYATVKNLMFYISEADLYSQATLFDGSTAGLTRIRAELNHEFSDKFRLGFAANYYGYSLSIASPYSRPTFTTRTDLRYNMSDKFILKSEIYTMNERKVLVIPSSTEATLKGFVDLNIGAEYRYNKNTSLFLNVNNITNNQYQKWYNLPVYGINVMGGLTLTF